MLLMDSVMTRHDFTLLLYDVWVKSGDDFSGVGIIVCDDTDHLPIVNLRDMNIDFYGTLSDVLSALSKKKGKYHDGFHIINKKGELTHVSQYFSPPIIRDASFDRYRLVGGRFVAALFGSSIPGVIMTGIVSEGHKLSIFENGQEVHYKELK